MLKLNGKTVKKGTISLKVGDKLQLDNKGFIENSRFRNNQKGKMEN